MAEISQTQSETRPVEAGASGRVAVDSAARAVAEFLGTLIKTAQRVLLVRLMTRDLFGDYQLVIVLVGLFVPLLDFGLDSFLMREYSRCELKETKGRVLWNALALKLLLSVTASAAGTFVLLWRGYSIDITIAALILFAAFPLKLFSLLYFPFRDEVKMAPLILKRVVMDFSGALILCLLVWQQAALPLLFLSMTVFDGLFFLIVWREFKNRADVKFTKSLDIGFCRAILAEAWPMMFLVMANYTLLKIDQVMLYEMLGARGPDQLAPYSLAVALTENTTLFAGALSMTVFPLLAKSHGKNDGRFDRVYRSSFKIMFLPLAPVVVFLAFYAREIIFVLFESGMRQYRYGDLPAMLGKMVWAGIFLSINSQILLLAVAVGRYRPLVFVYLFSMVLNIALNLILIPSDAWYGGANGAILASLLSYLLLSLSGFLVKELRAVTGWAWASLALPLFLSFVLIGGLHYAAPKAFLLLPLAALFYGFILWKSPYLNAEEKAVITRLIKRG